MSGEEAREEMRQPSARTKILSVQANGNAFVEAFEFTSGKMLKESTPKRVLAVATTCMPFHSWHDCWPK